LSVSNHEWYAIRVRSRCEKMVSEQLQQKGYEQFLPMYWSRRRWSDRVKVLQMPLFAGYVFCSFDVGKRLPIQQTFGVVHIVGKGQRPTPINPIEMENIRLAVTSGHNVQPWPHLEVGSKVRIEIGPLRGVTGTLLRYKNSAQLILGVDLMQRAIAVEVQEDWVVPCNPSMPVVQEVALAHT
jgi:transcriptional antiterminator NusG